jgi:hypothetical protein
LAAENTARIDSTQMADNNKSSYHSSLSRVNADHVEGDRHTFYPEFLVSTKQRGDLRCVNDVLARQAGDI